MDADIFDAGKRFCDIINLHMTYGEMQDIRDKFMAISLADGSSDGHMYDSKVEAIKHQLHEQQCYYFSFRGVNPGGVNAYECAVMLQFQRNAYKSGLRLVDPDDRFGGKQAMMTTAQFDYFRGRAPRPRVR